MIYNTVEVCDRIVALNKGVVKIFRPLKKRYSELEIFRCLNFHISKEMYFTSHYTKDFFKSLMIKNGSIENQYI
jgi:hypothetical protein